MRQIARNMTMEGWRDCRYLLHDREVVEIAVCYCPLSN